MSEQDDDDRAYVIAALTKLLGDQADIVTRLSIAEDRLDEVARGFDAIEDAAAPLDPAASDPAALDPAALDPATGADAVTELSVDLAADTDAAEDPEQEQPDGIDMRELVGWVRDHIVLLLERKLPQTGTPPHWCRSWWMHAEAIARFEAVRRSWAESVSAGGNAMVVYFEHLDHQMAMLMGDGGPFTGCAGGNHRPGAVPALGHDEPDPAYFVAFDTAHNDPALGDPVGWRG